MFPRAARLPVGPSALLYPLVFLGWGSPIPVQASPEGNSGAESAVEEEALLPSWEEGDCREAFDVRIWPERILIWLEEENLKSLIADENVPEGERQRLKRIFAMQRAWRGRYSGKSKDG